MALVDTDLFVVQDSGSKTSYKITFANLTQDLESSINLDTEYVQKSGDNVAGDLTVGPEGNVLITLDATEGNITLAGTLVGQKGRFTEIQGYGGLEIYGDPANRTSGLAITVDSQGNVVLDKTLTVESDSEFKTSITVANDVTVGGKLTAANAQLSTKLDGTSGLNLYSDPAVQKGIEIDAAGDVNLAGNLTLDADLAIDNDLTVLGDTTLINVSATEFSGSFVGDGSGLTDLPIQSGKWDLNGKVLTPIESNASLDSIVDITISGELKAGFIDGGEYV